MGKNMKKPVILGIFVFIRNKVILLIYCFIILYKASYLFAFDLDIGVKLGYPNILSKNINYKTIPMDTKYNIGLTLSHGINDNVKAIINVDFFNYYSSKVWWCYTMDHSEKNANLTDYSITCSLFYLIIKKNIKPFIGLNYGIHKFYFTRETSWEELYPNLLFDGYKSFWEIVIGMTYKINRKDIILEIKYIPAGRFTEITKTIDDDIIFINISIGIQNLLNIKL